MSTSGRIVAQAYMAGACGMAGTVAMLAGIAIAARSAIPQSVPFGVFMAALGLGGLTASLAQARKLGRTR